MINRGKTGILLFLLFSLTVTVFAEGDGDLEFFGLEAEKLLYLGSAVLAAALCAVAAIAFARTQRTRLLFVVLAFALFALQGFLLSHELFFPEWSWVDPIASVLSFGIMLAFFFGMVKK
ncbi:hypothetical protein HYV84_07065 [Candidatus Woesearchaeota archaeon]|nr:hypothetical protein [Candidatus Woesearchaeota archaeon]